ncbi:MAG: transcriptional regulator [Gammaproteobacteria bacterium]|nr:MAG: transcriptional regulator [Gammaproteobacteria bacterium]
MKFVRHAFSTIVLITTLFTTLITTGITHAAQSTIGILVYDGFLTSDVTAPIEVFGAATQQSELSSYQVVLISAAQNKTVVSEEGLKIIADKTIFDPLKLDVLLVPSAYDMTDALNNQALVAFIKQQSQTASWVASNCSGAFLLAETGFLDGKKATTWAGGEAELLKAYPKVDVQFDQNVVIDGSLITSNGGPVSYQAAFELLTQLSSKKFSDKIAQSLQFDRLHRAFRSGL